MNMRYGLSPMHRARGVCASTVATDAERKKLDKLTKTGYFHFFVLVVLIFVASLLLHLPEEDAALPVLTIGGLILLTGVSTVHLQYFRRCPRCSARMSRVKPACASCGLQYYPPKRRKKDTDNSVSPSE